MTNQSTIDKLIGWINVRVKKKYFQLYLRYRLCQYSLPPLTRVIPISYSIQSYKGQQ